MTKLGRGELQKRFLSDYAATGIPLKEDMIPFGSIMKFFADLSRNRLRNLQNRIPAEREPIYKVYLSTVTRLSMA